MALVLERARMLLWIAALVFLSPVGAQGGVRSREVIEPPAQNYPIERFAKVAVLQWTQPEYAPVPASAAVAEAYKASNRHELERWAERAAASGAELLVTPEFGVTGYPKTADHEDQFQSPEEVAPYVETVPGPSTEYFGEMTRRLGIWFAFSLAHREVDGHYYNSLVLMDPAGRIAGVHHKRNLFGSEVKFLSRGRTITVMDTPMGRIGMMICADVYHAPTIEDYRKASPDVMLVSAAWTTSGAMSSFRGVARSIGATVVASNLADYPDSGVINSDGSMQSHIRETRGLAFGYVKRRNP